jgi:thymidylate synthase ThyX
MKVYLLPNKILKDPEVVAMLQAYNSRSFMSIKDRLLKFGIDVDAPEEPDTILDSVRASFAEYYVGYGHDSIGQCGNIPVFFEGVSLLYAKVLQNNKLYNGQETSTRFIDFTSNVPVTPGTYGSREHDLYSTIQRNLLNLYARILPAITENIAHRFPLQKDQDEKEWKRAVKAKAFDITRCLLPAGCRTNVSFYGSISNLRESLEKMLCHPLAEVNTGASTALLRLAKRYPTSFEKPYHKEEHRVVLKESKQVLGLSYSTKSLSPRFLTRLGANSSITQDSFTFLPPEKLEFLKNRPRGLKVPPIFNPYGKFCIDSTLDFGSFRDIQRHRNCHINLPLLTTELGFHPWYLEKLEDYSNGPNLGAQPKQNFAKDTQDILEQNLELLIRAKEFDSQWLSNQQYAIPLGYKVPLNIDLALDQMFYIAELRSSRHVHETLRPLALDITKYLEEWLPGVPVYADREQAEFFVSRGKQTIEKREEVL